MNRTNAREPLPKAIYWLAFGAFAIGTEAFMISPLLPGLAGDLSVSIEAAGQLVTLFALAYGLSSPVLTALTGNISRKRLMLFSMIAFAISNFLAFLAPSYGALMAARILLAFSAGLFVPGANALAGAIVAPERRGTAIAVVNAGITVAIALGVPLGAIIGHALGWRMTFGFVAGLATIAAIGLAFGLPKNLAAGLPIASLRERIEVAGRPIVLATLLTTTLWATGAYTVYTYLSPYLVAVASLTGPQIALVMTLWGVAAGIGVLSGGRLSDRFGPVRVIVPTIALAGLAFLSLSLSAEFLSVTMALAPVLLAIATWGIAHWAFYPAQQARLIAIGGVKVAPIVLSLNASFMYIGFSLGAALGALVLAKGGVDFLGFAAAGGEFLALLLSLVTARWVAGTSPAARKPLAFAAGDPTSCS
jgi:predicted MFS family arabinose efflux permease